MLIVIKNKWQTSRQEYAYWHWLCNVWFQLLTAKSVSGDSSAVRALDSWSKGRWFESRRSGGRIFFSRVKVLCWFLFCYSPLHPPPLHPPSRVTAVARKISQSFCQKCRWQVTAKYTCTLPMRLWMKWHCKLVHGCIVYTERRPRRHQLCNSQERC